MNYKYNLLKSSIRSIYYKELSGIFNEISSFNYACIKGESLSARAYNAPNIRDCSDIDIIIHRYNLRVFENIFFANGFSNGKTSRYNRLLMLHNSHQVAPLVKSLTPFGNVEIDLNFDIFWGEYEGKRINIEEFLSDTVEVEIYGVKVKTLTPIKTMIQLVLHHYKDMNSIFLLATRKSIKYEMFKDVYYLLKNNLDAISLDKLYMMSAEYEIIPYVFYVLYYTGQIFDDDVLRQYIEAFRAPEGEALLNCYGLCAKERKEWKYDFKTRLEADNLYELIKNDLTEKDKEKISINKRIFMGVSE